MKKGFQRLKMEKWLKIKTLLQSILEPIETQTKETHIAAVGAVNQ